MRTIPKTGWRAFPIGIVLCVATFLFSHSFLHRFFSAERSWDDALLALVVTVTFHLMYQRKLARKAIEEQRVRIFKATMTTVHDILGNFLSSMQYVRISGEKSLPAESLQLFDSLITDAQVHLKALSDLEHPVEKKWQSESEYITRCRTRSPAWMAQSPASAKPRQRAACAGGKHFNLQSTHHDGSLPLPRSIFLARD